MIGFIPTASSTSSERGYVHNPSSFCSSLLPDIGYAVQMLNPFMNVSCSMETNSMSHSHTGAQPACLLVEHPVDFGCHIFSPQDMGDLCPAPSCFPQVTPYGLVVGIIIGYQPSQELKNLNPLQVLSACTKRVLEICSSLMLAH